MRPSVARPRTS